MFVVRMVMAGLVVCLVAEVARGGPARQYRGPDNEAPRGIALPGVDGLLGSERFDGPSRQVEGLDRWEFWWETNRTGYLRAALDAKYASREMPESSKVFAALRPVVPRVEDDDARRRILPVLMKNLRSADSGVRVAAALALGRARYAAAFGPLIGLLRGGSRDDRRAAALALGMLGEPIASEPLTELLKRSGVPPRERAYAAVALGMLKSTEAAPVLARVLVDSTGVPGRGIEELQAACAAALGLIGDRRQGPLLVRVAAGRVNRPDSVRGAALIALGRLGEAAAVPLAVRLLSDNRVAVRRAAAETLGMLGDPIAAQALADAFHSDADAHVRGLSAVGLAKVVGRGAGRLLEGSLGPETPRAVRGYTAIAMGLTGNDRCAQPLRELLDDKGESSVRSAAVIGLALLGDVASAPLLRRIALTESGSDGLRGYAVVALALLGDARIGRKLPALAGAKGADVRRSAILAMGLYPEIRGGAACIEALSTEADPYVRGAAINSLALTPRRSVLDALCAATRRGSAESDARVDAVTALGVLGARGGRSSAEELWRHADYRSSRGALRVVLGLF